MGMATTTRIMTTIITGTAMTTVTHMGMRTAITMATTTMPRPAMMPPSPSGWR